MTASTRIAVSRHAPDDRPNTLCTAGTTTIMPTRPYMTEGMPASSSTAVFTSFAILGGATFERYSAVIMPIGTPMTTAPAVP